MDQSLNSERFRIASKEKNSSISQIQHQKSKISFSVLSLLQNEQYNKEKQKVVKKQNNEKHQNFQKQYINSSPLKNKRINLQNNSVKQCRKIKLPFQNIKKYQGEYFENQQYLSPKNLGKLSKKKQKIKYNSERNINVSRTKSLKSNRSSKQLIKESYRSTFFDKNPSNNKRILTNNKQIVESKTKKQQKFINYLFISNSNGKLNLKDTKKIQRIRKIKSCKQIIIICHNKKYQNMIQDNVKVSKDIYRKQNFSLKMKPKSNRLSLKLKTSDNQNKQNIIKNNKQQKKVQFDYWGSPFNVKKTMSIKTLKNKNQQYYV